MKKTKKIMAYLLVLAIMLSNIVISNKNTTIEVEAASQEPVVVVLDPGHLYSAPGAYSPQFYCSEVDANYAIAYACKAELEKYDNVVVYLTSDDGYTIKGLPKDTDKLSGRVDYAKSVNADLFVSLHNNAGSLSANGGEVYINIVEPFNSNIKQLATDICNGFSSLGLTNRGVKYRESTWDDAKGTDYYTVMDYGRSLGIPSIIVEHAFVTNGSDAAKLNDHPFRIRLGQNDAKAIAKYFNLSLKTDPNSGAPTIYTTPHLQSYGWMATTPEGKIAGLTTAASGYTALPSVYEKRLEAFKFDINTKGVSGGLEYQSYTTKYGWSQIYGNGQIAGSTGESRAVEAIRLNLTGDLKNRYDVYYRTYSSKIGWTGWSKNGENNGSSGYGYEMRAIQVQLVAKNGAAPGTTDKTFYMNLEASDIAYSTHVQSQGWQEVKGDGNISGTTGIGKRLEGIKIYNYTGVSGSIEYQVHCQGYGWMEPVKDGQLAGTTGEAKRLEAIRINLTGELAEKYDVYYQVHAQSYGWLDWAKNGESAGTTTYAKRLEAIRIILVEKGQPAPGNTTTPYVGRDITYTTHVQSIGWTETVGDGVVSGTVGSAKRLEGIKISNTSGVSGDIIYDVHCQTYGWLNGLKNGQLAGTEGQAKRLEAIRIRLNGQLAEKYDVYYRVHSQTYGWLDWACNGQDAGTEGLAKRLEAIEIRLVPKGGQAPGPTATPFIK